MKIEMLEKVMHGREVFEEGETRVVPAVLGSHFCARGWPTSIAECDSLSLIPAHTLTGGDFSKANGDVSGRKLTVAAQNSLSIDASGSATHIAINNGVDYYVTTCTSQALTSGGTVSVPAWDIEIADPV